MLLSLPLLFFSLKKYVFRNELRGATTTQARIGLLTKGSTLLFLYSEPVEPFGGALYAEGRVLRVPDCSVEVVCAVVPE
jgi:hypothetical protein